LQLVGEKQEKLNPKAVNFQGWGEAKAEMVTGGKGEKTKKAEKFRA